MTHYICIRCNYNTDRKTDMDKHLKRKIKCASSHIEIFNKSDDEIYDLSMKPHKPIKEKINCEYCNKIFSRIDNLKFHQKTSCKNNKGFQDDDNKNKFSKYQTNIQSQTNIQQQINNYNNIIIINQNNKLNPFDEKWIVDHIDILKKYEIIFNDNKYTNLLKEILLNKENLNIVIDSKSNSGIVYKNDEELFVKMKLKEIIDKSMEKLYQQLKLYFEENNTDEYIQQNKDLITLTRREKYLMESKYKKYNNDTDVKNKVSELLSGIFNDNKKDSIEIANNIIENKKNIDKNTDKNTDKNGY